MKERFTYMSVARHERKVHKVNITLISLALQCCSFPTLAFDIQMYILVLSGHFCSFGSFISSSMGQIRSTWKPNFELFGERSDKAEHELVSISWQKVLYNVSFYYLMNKSASRVHNSFLLQYRQSVETLLRQTLGKCCK